MKYYIHFLLSSYGQTILDCFNDKLLSKSEAIDEAKNDLFNAYISEIEYNVIINELENN